MVTLRVAVAAGLLITFNAGCAVTGSVNLLGGREKCWSDTQPRMAALFTGRFELGPYPWTLEIPDDEDFRVDFAGLTLNDTATAVEDAGGNVVANEGELVTVFGGYGSDGVLLVCAIEDASPADR